jgi:hypothetical protein
MHDHQDIWYSPLLILAGNALVFLGAHGAQLLGVVALVVGMYCQLQQLRVARARGRKEGLDL